MSTNTSLLSMDGCRGRQAHFHTPSAMPGATLSPVALAYWANGYHKRSSPQEGTSAAGSTRAARENMPSDRCVRIPGEAWWASRRRWRGRVLPDEENFPRKCVVQAVRSLSSASITLAVCGDPIICRALVLLLQDFGYDVKSAFQNLHPVSEAGEHGARMKETNVEYCPLHAHTASVAPGFEMRSKFLPASYFGEPGSLEDVQILLLTPE